MAPDAKEIVTDTARGPIPTDTRVVDENGGGRGRLTLGVEY